MKVPTICGTFKASQYRQDVKVGSPLAIYTVMCQLVYFHDQFLHKRNRYMQLLFDELFTH